MIPPGFAQSTFRFQMGASGRPAAVVLGWATDSTDPESFAALLGGAFGTNIMISLASNVSFIETAVHIGNDGPLLEGSSTTGAASGGDSGDAYGENTALLVVKRTGLAGRSNRGRTYVPGVSEGMLHDGAHLQSGVRTAFQGQFDDFLSDVLAGDPGGTQVLLHTEDAPDTTPTPVTTYTVDNMVATQRRRLRK